MTIIDLMELMLSFGAIFEEHSSQHRVVANIVTGRGTVGTIIIDIVGAQFRLTRVTSHSARTRFFRLVDFKRRARVVEAPNPQFRNRLAHYAAPHAQYSSQNQNASSIVKNIPSVSVKGTLMRARDRHSDG